MRKPSVKRAKANRQNILGSSAPDLQALPVEPGSSKRRGAFSFRTAHAFMKNSPIRILGRARFIELVRVR
jgi:hypothetical protein